MTLPMMKMGAFPTTQAQQYHGMTPSHDLDQNAWLTSLLQQRGNRAPPSNTCPVLFLMPRSEWGVPSSAADSHGVSSNTRVFDARPCRRPPAAGMPPTAQGERQEAPSHLRHPNQSSARHAARYPRRRSDTVILPLPSYLSPVLDIECYMHVGWIGSLRFRTMAGSGSSMARRSSVVLNMATKVTTFAATISIVSSGGRLSIKMVGLKLAALLGASLTRI